MFQARSRPLRPLLFTRGSPARRWASTTGGAAMSFELILPFLRPIEPLLLDESISEIMGNPDASWWYERDGIISPRRAVSFDAGRLRTGLEVIANQLGKKLDEDNPVLHAQLPDGSRLAAVIPPVVRPAPALTIRKFTSRRLHGR